MTPERKEYFKKWQSENREKCKEAHKRFYAKNKEHLKAVSVAWREANKEKANATSLKSYYRRKAEGKLNRTPESRFRSKIKNRYGLTVEQYEKMLKDCDGKCQICGGKFVEEKILHIDHCHKSGAVRGLLCQQCNSAEGLLKTPEVALKMYEYMKRNEILTQGVN